MIQIELDNDVNNLPQVAIFKELVWSTENNSIKLKSIYGVYQNDEFTYGFKTLEQTANNSNLVNGKTGVPTTSDDPDAVGEYDFFCRLATSVKIDLPELIRSYMTKAKVDGRYI